MAGTSSERFAPVNDPELVRRAGLGRLVAHLQPPRFVGSVDLKKGSLRVILKVDDLQAWSREHATPGQNPQAPLFKLCSEMIDWARANRDSLSPQSRTVWSPLPKNAFAGRSATSDDLDAGTAYFVLEGGRPIDIAIPQYAYTFDAETNEPIPCILLQAEEEPRGDKVVAFLNLRNHREQLGYFDSFKLLGQENPEIQPTELVTPRYGSLSNAVKNLSGLVSAERGVTNKRAYLKENQETINALLGEGLKYCSPLEYFTLLDGVKSLVSRDLFLRKRAVAMGAPEPGIMLHAINAEQTCSVLEDDPEVCVFSLHQTPEEEFYGLLLFVDRGEIKAERFPISTGQAGHGTANELRELTRHRMWDKPEETGRRMFPLLELFGSTIIPRLRNLGEPRKLIVIPHRWTHILPLHMMTMENGGSITSLDDVVTGTTFVSSLTAFQWSAKSSLSAVRPGAAKAALLCVDVENLGGGAQFELTAYRNMLADVDGADIVTIAADIPSDLSAYPVVLWSSHGVSDPTNWERNRLLFQSEVFSADRISREWNLRTAFVGILAACETGIDLSVDEALDEYMGLDMALQIAAARPLSRPCGESKSMSRAILLCNCLKALF